MKKTNNKALSNIIGAVLLIGITLPIYTTVAILSTNASMKAIDKINDGIEYMDNMIYQSKISLYNHLPTVSNEYPADGATDVVFNPTLSIYVADEDGDMLRVQFYMYDPYGASEQRPILDIFTEANRTVFCPITANIPHMTYYWYVIVIDIYTGIKSPYYSFTTTF